MPKAIKKKTATKPKTRAEENVISGIRAFASANKKFISTGAITLGVVAALVSGLYFFRLSNDRKADSLEYEGYKLYHNLYQREPMPVQGRLEKALESFSQAYKVRRSPYALYYTANIYADTGRYEEALNAYRELNREFPDDEYFVPLSYYRMAMLNMKAGKHEEAIKLLEALSNYKSNSFKDLVLVELARVLEGTGRTEDAKKKYEALKKDFPESPFAKEAETKLKSPPADKTQGKPLEKGS